MITREVSQKQWKPFCERINKACLGTMVSIEVLLTDGTKLEIAHNVPLRAVDFEVQADACNNNLVIEAGNGNLIAREGIADALPVYNRRGGRIIDGILQNRTSQRVGRPVSRAFGGSSGSRVLGCGVDDDLRRPGSSGSETSC